MRRIMDSFVGTTPVARIYLGEHLVWDSRVKPSPLTVPFAVPFTLLELAPDDAT